MEELIEKGKTRMKNLEQGLKEEVTPLVLVAFVFSTALMMFQHSRGWAWDFTVYSMIGEYIFHDGIYMEWLRPPVASTIMGLFQFVMSRRLAEYAFILTSSLFFTYAANRVSKAYELDFEAFYILTLTPASIYYSTLAGTEMLSLGFVMLFFADLDKPKSGLWLGLAFLTRYNWGLLIPLTLIQFDIKKIIKTGILAGLTLVPWLAYNFFVTGNPIYSFSNFLMLNVILREATSPLALENFILATLPAALLVLWYLKSEIREKVSFNRPDIFMLAFTGLTSFFYLTASLRSIRYLHALILPVAYFAEKVWQEIGLKKVLIAIVTVNLVFGGLWILEVDLTSPERYEAASSSDYLGECMSDSQDWPLMNYAGIPTHAASTPNVTEKRLDEGYRALRFKNNDYYEPSAPVLDETEFFKIYGYENKCKPVEKADMSYLEGLEERTGSEYTLRGHIFQEFIKNKIEAII